MRTLAVAVVLGLGITASGQDQETMKKEVIEVDRARQAAFDKGDGDAWFAHIIDACRWTNLVTGEVLQDKAQRAANLTKEGPAEPSKLSDEKFHFGGGGGNTVTQTGLYSGGGRGGSARVARIWQKRDGRWMMIALYFAPQ
jgi:hypothetical protein